MSYSDGLKINVNRLNATEKLLILLEISHPFLNESVRLVNDNEKLISNGETFLPMAFRVKRQDDIQGELPKVTLTVSNVGRTLVKWIDSTGGGRDASISVMLARRSQPDLIEERLELGIESINITTEVIVFNLVVQNNLTKRAIKYIYDKHRTPGLF
jgi:hypothetical protein